ncbi:MAG: HTTM domain-containing protein [Candidatus Hydrogenedentes bacterium]|nr:HTTM domain-containing protein [Candidatus Hydrogenedentota bacterium]
MTGWWVKKLLAPVDAASLAVFRIVFAATMFALALFYYSSPRFSIYAEEAFRFRYYGFEWVPVWSSDARTLLVYVLGASALLLLAGFCYRIAAIAVALCHLSLALMDIRFYQNHMYLLAIISILMVVIPAHRAFSVDASLRVSRHGPYVPAWCVWILRIQFALVYFWAGVAKLQADWLLGVPLRIFADRSEHANFITGEFAILGMSYAGLLFDLLVGPALLWRKTRLPAYCVSLLFHLINYHLWGIDVFPHFMMGATLVFFAPDWPRAVIARVLRRSHAPCEPVQAAPQDRRRFGSLQIAFFTVFVLWQGLMPLRPYFYPGAVHWNEEGQLYAWRMMSVSKRCVARFHAYDPHTKRRWELEPRDFNVELYTLAGWLPEIQPVWNAVQFARHAANVLRDRGLDRVEIYADLFVSINRRKPELLIDPAIDLASVEYGFMPVAWIRDLREPLPRSNAERDAASRDWVSKGGNYWAW